MAITNWITGAGILASCIVGEIGCLMLFAVVWFPIAGVIKQEVTATRLAHAHIANNSFEIQVTDGHPIRVWTGGSSNNSSEDLALGISMGEP